MSNFVEISEDKFEKKTTYQNSIPLNLDGHMCMAPELKYRRVVVMPDKDFLLMDIEVTSFDGGWPQLNKGKLIMLIDGESVTLKPYENWHNCDTYNGRTTYKESCYFEMDKDLLKRICDSESFYMQLYGGNGKGEVENVNAIVVYSKLFYNAVYDNTVYTDVVANALREFTRDFAYVNKFRKIALDGSGACDANGGCMGMLALLIVLIGATMGEICVLI